MRDDDPLYLANEPANPNIDLDVTDNYTGEIATRVAMASAADIDRAFAVHATCCVGPPLTNKERKKSPEIQE